MSHVRVQQCLERVVDGEPVGEVVESLPAEFDVGDTLCGDGPVFAGERTECAHTGESRGDADAEPNLVGAVVVDVLLTDTDAEGHGWQSSAGRKKLAISPLATSVVGLRQVYVSPTSDVRTNGARVSVHLMGIMDKLLTGGDSHTTEDYVELDLDDFDTARGEAGMQVHIAEISGQQDVVAIKDAVYDGDFVIADITRLRTQDRTVEHIIDELQQVAQEVDGDIVQKGDDQLIVTPTGITIARQKLS
mgnify:CR=1 FL=1